MQCAAGVAHTVSVILPTPHINEAGKAKQLGELFFFTDRNVTEMSFALNALLEGKIEDALTELQKVDAANLPTIQRAYWQNDVAVCFVLQGRYKEAEELLLQAGLNANEEAIRYNYHVNVYLTQSQRYFATKKAQEENSDAQPDAPPPLELPQKPKNAR